MTSHRSGSKRSGACVGCKRRKRIIKGIRYCLSCLARRGKAVLEWPTWVERGREQAGLR